MCKASVCEKGASTSINTVLFGRQAANTGLLLCRVVAHTTAAVFEAEDGTGRRWALKRIQGDNQSVREAERLFKLKGHPLIVPLESVFVDKGATYFQMPFYQHGNLRTWVEQLKVSFPETNQLL